MSKRRGRNFNKQHKNLSNSPLTSPRSLDDILAIENKIALEKQMFIEKALSGTDVDALMKAKNYIQNIEKKQEVDIKSITVDPMNVYGAFGYRNKPFQLSYDMLRGMSNVHIIKSIKTTRKAQILNYCEPQADRYSTGFVIDKRTKWRATERDKQLTAQEQKRADEITQFLLDCGTTNNYWSGDDFSKFVGKLMDDSLSMDQATAEVVRDRAGRPIEFFATDGATFRVADSYDADGFEKEEEKVNGYTPSHVQVYNGKVIAQFYPWELAFCTRNQSTDIRTHGYGKSELEDMIATVTSILNADAYNANYFKIGSSPQGILTYTGNINQNTLDDFRQQWQAQVAGVANAHRIPIINGDKINFIPTRVPNKDMEFAKFQEFLIKIACAIFIIDPSEINFPMSGSVEGNDGLGGRNNSEKLKYSKDKGLKPLLKHLQYWINKWIVWQIDPEFEFRFVGVDDTEDKETELDQDIKRVGSFVKMNEVRAKYNLDPIEGGDVVLNPVFIQAMMMAMQGNQESNEAVDDMQDDRDNPDNNPFLKSLNSDLEKILAT